MQLSSLPFVSQGARFVIAFQRPDLQAQLQALLPPGSRVKELSRPDVVYSLLQEDSRQILMRGSEELGRFSDLPSALSLLSSDLHFQVALHARRRLFVHAGAVAWQGRAILIPGQTFTGKSTLVDALVREGAVYFSDEYAVLDGKGLVRPYRKPISLRHREGAEAKRPVLPTKGPDPGPVPLGLILTTRYRPGASFRPRNQTSGEAFLSLLNNTVVARLRPRFAMNILGKAVPGAIAVEGDRGEARRVAGRILELSARCHGDGKEED